MTATKICIQSFERSVNYDVIIPSDYMISRLIQEDMLMKLDFSQISGNTSNIDEQYKNLIYDPKNKYSVPYTWVQPALFTILLWLISQLQNGQIYLTTHYLKNTVY